MCGASMGGGPIDFQSQTQHLAASNIRIVFWSEEVIHYFVSAEIGADLPCAVHVLLSLKASTWTRTRFCSPHSTMFN